MKGTLKSGGAVASRLIEARTELATQDDTGPLVYQHGLLCQVGLPRSRQKERTFERTYKNAALRIDAGSLFNGQRMIEQPLPFGTKPRVALFYINSQAVKTGSPIIDIGKSYKEFCERLRLSVDGKTFYDLKRQMQALAAARVTLGFAANGMASTLNVQPIERFDAWLSLDGQQQTLWPAALHLSRAYHETLLEHAVPMPENAVAALSHSAIALDELAWLARRLPTLEKPLRVPFVALKEQFGQEYKELKDFRKEFLQALRQVLTVYQGAKVEQVTGGLMLKPSRSIVRRTMIKGYRLPQDAPKTFPKPYSSRELPEAITTEFMATWPTLDVYACKGNFDRWLDSAPEPPKNYGRAFLGFAKKWANGKY